MEYIGNPHHGLKFIHVGGTSGKGSTTRFISSILESQGLKVGAFYSPHIYTIRERIQFNNDIISDSEFADIFNYIDGKVQKFVQVTKNRPLTYFEILFAMAIVYFVEKKVDVAVIEVGLGGKLDATNVIYSQIAVLTNVSLDHTHILGDTVEEILNDKKEIIKKDSTVVTGVIQSNLKYILKKHAKKQNSEIFLIDEDIKFEIKKESFNDFVFSYEYDGLKLDNLSIRMIGYHQVLNAVLALTAALTFMSKLKRTLNYDRLCKFIAEVRLPGRIEVQSQKPLIIWDAAHNQEKMSALTDVIDKYTEDRIHLLVAVKKGQDVYDIFKTWQILSHRIDQIVLTQYVTSQDVRIESENLELYLPQFKSMFPDTEVVLQSDALKAYDFLQSQLVEGSMMIVTGSFYLFSYLGGKGC